MSVVFSTPSFHLLVPLETKLHPVVFCSWSLGPSELHHNLAVLGFLSFRAQKFSEVNYPLSQHLTALSGDVSFGGYVFGGCLSSGSTPDLLGHDHKTCCCSAEGSFLPRTSSFLSPHSTMRWLPDTSGNTQWIFRPIGRRWDVYP